MFLLDMSALTAEHVDLHTYERLRRTCKGIRLALTDNDQAALSAAKVTFSLVHSWPAFTYAQVMALAEGYYNPRVVNRGWYEQQIAGCMYVNLDVNAYHQAYANADTMGAYSCRAGREMLVTMAREAAEVPIHLAVGSVINSFNRVYLDGLDALAYLARFGFAVDENGEVYVPTEMLAGALRVGR